MSTNMVSYQDKQGQMHTVTPDQLQTIDPWLYSKYVQNVAQPAAGLNATNTSTAATGASIPGITANSQVDQSKALLTQDHASISDLFGKNIMNSGVDKGWVDPDVYNQAKEKFVHDGGDSATFDGAFASNYVSPDDISYATDENKSIQQTLPAVANVIKSYYSLPSKGINAVGGNAATLEALQKIPGLGPYLANSQLLTQDNAHDTLLNGLALKIKGIVQQGSSQGFRNIGVLNGITDLLPSSTDGLGAAQQKLGRLDSYLQNSMNVSLSDLSNMGGGSGQ